MDMEQYIVGHLMRMSEDELKKESTDHLSQLITHLILPNNSSMTDDARYNFWLQHTLKMMNCSSIVLKLYAWDQVNDIIREALNTKPHASEYIVRGAGNPYANGTYSAMFGVDEVPKYVKAKGSPIGAPELTLFRCTMRSKMKWWFISEADPEKPGTDKDIDYYQHKSVGEQQEREPPTSGWVLAASVGSPGRYPPPILEPKGRYVPNASISIDSFLISKIPAWVEAGGVLDVVFGTTMHRELISRSRKLFNFLADVDALTESYIHKIWKASMSCHDSELSDEILGLLGALSLHLNDTLYGTLMDLLIGALKSDEGGKEGRENRFSKVAVFVEKFHHEFSRGLFQLSTDSGIQFLSLIWYLYRHPLSETSKAQPIFEDMLSLCLHERWNGGNVVAYVTECTEQLQDFSLAGEKKVNEAQVSRILQSLIFMLSHESMRGTDIDLSVFGVADILHGELLRFVRTQRPLCLEQKGGDVDWYKSQLAKRLHLVRVFYGLSAAVSMTREMIIEMWQLLSFSAEREELLVFFKDGGVRTASKESAFGLTECIYIFKNMICSPEIDWTGSTEGMYDCFTTYSDGMKKACQADQELYDISRETLWRITLSTPLDDVANKAIIHLLRVYGTYDVDACNRLVERVFLHLSEFDEKSKSCLGVASVADIRRVGRCVSILSSSIADGAGSVRIPHITRGCMNRIRVNVTCRIQPAYYDTRAPKKATEQTMSLDMHPMSSILAFKMKICALIDGAKPERVYLNFGNHYISSPDSTQLSVIGVVDGSEVIASLNLNNYGTSVYDDAFDDYKNSGHQNVSVLSNHEIYFNILFSLLDKFTNATSDNVSSDIGKAIWKIMMEIPTQPAILKSVIECSSSRAPGSKVAWDALLHTNVNTSSASMTYLLQIIDGLIQPAVEIPGEQVSFVSFIESGGFSAVLEFFLARPKVEPNTEFRKISETIALHIIHFCLFGQSHEVEDNGDPSVFLIHEVNIRATDMVETLLSVANFAAEGGQTGSVQDALFTLTFLLKSPDIVAQLTSNPEAKSLLTSVLRHESKRVRDMAADFAVQVGKTQKVVFEWLLAEVEGMSTSEKNCDELFSAFRILLIEQRSVLAGGSELKTLACMLSNKLMSYPHSEAAIEYPAMLIGCLTLLKSLVDIDVSALDQTDLGKDFVNIVLSNFLFAMPTPEVDKSSLCVRPMSRKSSFAGLIAYLNQRPENYPPVFQQLYKLLELSAVQLRHSWAVSSFHDHRRYAKVGFTGLKNQGCTCYSNSLLQQLFMNVPFREAVMKTPLRASHRSSLWHLKDDEIVGKDILLEWEGGSWHQAHVVTFDHSTGFHVIRYKDMNGLISEEMSFNIRGGACRIKKETGRVKLLRERLCGVEINAPSESEASAYRILEQLQRTFCFLEHSKQAYIDPRPLIEACRTLNLNYDVYHQNDASEFCDQLLDRLETAMRGKHTGIDIWKRDVLTNIFGGGMLYQKIPEECEFFETDRRECGHWQSTREEAFLKCELIIRGKENIEESLEQLVEGELMNGDNKIMCEKCNTKKDTVRRTCFDVLPNTMIIHLKRFDLDFQTFETVKLNNKIAFPNRLSMFKYTKEGMEAEEQAKIFTEEGGALNNPDLSREISDPTPPTCSRSNSMAGDNVTAPLISVAGGDVSDYEYELQGVLVHAGIAAGGHYYSFIRDVNDNSSHDGKEVEKWYRFNDEDVSSFNPENIPTSCFGGTYSTTSAMHDVIEEDRSANALMLFYRKVKPTTRECKTEETNSGSAGAGAGVIVSAGPTPEELAALNSMDPLINGYQAFEREVWETNMKHLVTEYVLDADLHGFVRSILSAMCVGSDTIEEGASALNLTTIPMEIKMNEMASFGIHFFVDVVLHCKDRSGINLWMEVLVSYFKKFPFTAEWFLLHVMTKSQCSWLRDFLLHCTDALACATFVQLIVAAGQSVFEHSKTQGPEAVIKANERVLALADSVLDMLPLVPLNFRTADEIFVALRDLSSIQSVAEHLVKNDVIAKLAYFVMPAQVPTHIRALYESTGATVKDFSSLLQTVFEVISAVMGIPQIRRISLIEEDPVTMLSQLSRPAVGALTAIFKENCKGAKMEYRDLLDYMERVSSNSKQASIQTRNIIERFGDRMSCLSLDGFLQSYLKNAVYNPKSVWKDLTFFGFQNDLTRSSGISSATTDPGIGVSSAYSTVSDHLLSVMPGTSKDCLLKLAFYEAAMYNAEAAAIAVARRFCFRDEEASLSILQQSLNRLNRTIIEFWSTDTEMILNFIRALMSLEDGLLSVRMQEVVFGEYGFLTKYYVESQRSAGGAGRQTSYSHESKIWADTYLKQFRVLCNSSPTALTWVEEHVFKDASHSWLIPSIQPIKGML